MYFKHEQKFIFFYSYNEVMTRIKFFFKKLENYYQDSTILHTIVT